RAVAMGRIYLGPVGFEHVVRHTLPKGDVLKLAEMAGIQGAKNTGATIPLCHPLTLDYVALHLTPEAETSAIAAYCVVSTTAKTGVEMEALAGVNAALLTVYDLVKPVEPALEISGIRLLLKEGGKKGLWMHPAGIPDFLQIPAGKNEQPPLHGINAAVLTLSDRANSGVYKDASGELLKSLLQQCGAAVTHYRVLPDEPALLAEEITKLATAGKTRLLICTGGTGLAARDITPDTVLPLFDRVIPGIGELLRSSGARQLPLAWLSRSVAGTVGSMLVITLPGSRGAVQDGMAALAAILPHALRLLAGEQPQQHLHKTPESA
ncbi:MAG TPA: bifunctional molybdenum cofactor biosynthesis protein MoaC/MoaB, partial [Gammaproteobacteria bacterium]